MTDHSKQYFYEARMDRDGMQWQFKVYHYDKSGNREIVLFRSGFDYDCEALAICAAEDYCTEHTIEPAGLA